MQFGDLVTILYTGKNFARTRLISPDTYRNIGSPLLPVSILPDSGHKIKLKAGITNSLGSIYYNLQKLPDPFRLTGTIRMFLRYSNNGQACGNPGLADSWMAVSYSRLLPVAIGTKTSLLGLLLHYTDYNW